MYVHVPAAWMALFGYLVLAGGERCRLLWRHPLAEVAARAAAPLGAVFTAICLVTGSLWGKPMWGTWWVWDARLTSVLVLLFLYLGYIALATPEDPAAAPGQAGILALVGVVNLPIIQFSVDWWNTLHQPNSIFRMGGPTIDKSMLWPLAVTALVYHLYFVAVLLLRMRAQLTERRIENLRLSAGGSVAVDPAPTCRTSARLGSAGLRSSLSRPRSWRTRSRPASSRAPRSGRSRRRGCSRSLRRHS